MSEWILAARHHTALAKAGGAPLTGCRLRLVPNSRISDRWQGFAKVGIEPLVLADFFAKVPVRVLASGRPSFQLGARTFSVDWDPKPPDANTVPDFLETLGKEGGRAALLLGWENEETALRDAIHAWLRLHGLSMRAATRRKARP